MKNKAETWTITVELTVFAGDMDKETVKENAVNLLTTITDGTDICGFGITDVKRDEL